MRRLLTCRAALLPVVVVTVPAGATMLVGAGPASAPARVAVTVLVALQAASLVPMGRRPEAAVAVSLAAGVGLEALWPQLGFLGIANFSLCVFAMLRRPRVSLWALAFMVALTPWAVVRDGAVGGLIAAGGPVLSWSWGELLRTRRARRDDAARRAVAEERARIARELHDVVAHNVSLMVVQAVAAADVFDARPQLAREALGAIETSGRAALAELRRLLGTVRPDHDGEHDPQPGLAQLDGLVQSVRAAGLGVTVCREGEPVAAPAGVDLSAYRIVQEALTNTLRHARARNATVLVRYAPTRLELEVADDGRGPVGVVSDGGGHGLVGMRERAALLGGTLELGRGTDGGFRVRAALPLRP